jgi:nucleoid-associated protein YgaU
MAIFDRGKDKKAAQDAQKLADKKTKDALMAEYKAKHAETKASQSAARAEKAEKELKDMKAAKARQDLMAKQKSMRSGLKPLSGTIIPGMGPLGVKGPKFIANYTVKKGDTLSQIAKDFYGTTGPKYWNLIQAANKDIIKDVNKIDVGQVFKIPELPPELKK